MDLRLEIEAERLVAKRYEERGYVVTVGPTQAAVPFPLGTCRPDLLASNGIEHLLIDVKSGAERHPSAAYRQLCEQATRHPGWKLVLITVPQHELAESLSSSAGQTSIGTVTEWLHRMDNLGYRPGLAELILPKLCGAYMCLLHHVLVEEGADVDCFSDLGLLNHAYSLALISYGEYESMRHCLAYRSQAPYDFAPQDLADDCKYIRAMTNALLQRLLPDASLSPV